MRRKVNLVGKNTLTISLPSGWVKRWNIKKGNELNIGQKGNRLIIGPSFYSENSRIDIDVSNLDRTSIYEYIRALYRIGYDEISVSFSDIYTIHLRKRNKASVISVIRDEVNRLIGFEIVREKKNSCLIQNLSGEGERLEEILRKVFLLLNGIINDLYVGIKEDDKGLLESIYEKHFTISKFVSYCLRILNKRGYEKPEKITYLYHIIANLDKIVDIIKYSARDYLAFNNRFRKESLALIGHIKNNIGLYYNLFYKFDTTIAMELNRNRDTVQKEVIKLMHKVSPEELLVLKNLAQIPELMLEQISARMGLTY